MPSLNEYIFMKLKCSHFISPIASLLLHFQDHSGPDNADDILKNIKVPLAGDLLGRERVTGVKKTRLGCDKPSERFENIVETPALWHTKQSFLGVSIE